MSDGNPCCRMLSLRATQCHSFGGKNESLFVFFGILVNVGQFNPCVNVISVCFNGGQKTFLCQRLFIEGYIAAT